MRDYTVVDNYILENIHKKTNVQMASELGCDKSIISKRRKVLGLSEQDRRNKLHSCDEYIRSQYGKKNATDLAKEISCSTSYIKKIQAQAGLTGTKSQVYSLNESFFDIIDTKEKAYWLGWMASDGNLYKRDGHQGMVSLAISKEDDQILQRFKMAINTEKPISYTKDARRETYMATLQITSNKLYFSLIDKGLCDNKTFLFDLAILFEHIPLIFWPNFILGYFDGDGNIDIAKNNVISKSHVRIIGPLDNMKVFQDKLSSIGIECSIHVDRRKTENFGSIEFVNTTQKYSFLKYLYDSQETSLDRKRERAQELCRRIENNVTNRSENINAVKNYKSVVLKWGELLER